MILLNGVQACERDGLEDPLVLERDLRARHRRQLVALERIVDECRSDAAQSHSDRPQIVNAPSVPAGPVPASASTVDTASTTLQWTASTDATLYDVAFGPTNPPATVSANQSATTYLATSLQRGSTYYWQITAKGTGGTTPGPIWSFSVPATAAIVTFVGTDVITQGTWKGLYGRDGYAIAADATSLPSYVTLSQAGQLTWTFAASTTDARALQKSASTDRIAACWYGGQFSFDLDFVDGKAHDVAFYLVDWDLQNRDETITLVDSVSGAVLDSRRVSAFGSGQYWVWNVRGHVTVVTTANAVNALINGMFFDSAGGSVNQSPTVALTSPANGATATAPATISLSATAADPDGFVAKVDFYAGPTLIGTVTSLPFTGSWSNVPAGSYNFTAVATDNFGATTTSVAALVTVNGVKPKTASAVFAGTDTTTQGTWKGKYGSGGYAAGERRDQPAELRVGVAAGGPVLDVHHVDDGCACAAEGDPDRSHGGGLVRQQLHRRRQRAGRPEPQSVAVSPRRRFEQTPATHRYRRRRDRRRAEQSESDEIPERAVLELDDQRARADSVHERRRREPERRVQRAVLRPIAA